MKILSIDTSSGLFCIGLWEDDKFYSYSLELKTRLSSLITQNIKKVLDAVGWEPAEIDYFVCGLGPGSFTGLRIGLSTIKGLAWALRKPVVGVSTLDVIARNAPVTQGLVVPFIDARRNLVYSALYGYQKEFLKRRSDHMLLNPQDLFKKIKKSSRGKKVLFLGDGCGLFKLDILMGVTGSQILDKDYWYPRPDNLIRLALERIENGSVDDVFRIQPIYLYPQDCQVR